MYPNRILIAQKYLLIHKINQKKRISTHKFMANSKANILVSPIDLILLSNQTQFTPIYLINMQTFLLIKRKGLTSHTWD